MDVNGNPAPGDLQGTLESFVQMLKEHLAARLVSVILYGSIVFDDLAPGYGDLDFLAIVEDDLSERDYRQLIELRRPLRLEGASIFQHMLEGAFLPRPMLDPAVTGTALWWGTTGERPWQQNQLGPLVLHVIRRCGRVIYGQDLREAIPEVPRQDMLAEVRQFCQSARQHGRGGTLHSIDWLLTAARLLLWVREGRLSSKSQAADWGCEHARGSWRQLLPRARFLRLHPAQAQSPEWAQWLPSLTEPIQQAAEELEAAAAFAWGN